MIDLLVAGGGPAGLATAIHAAEAGMSVLVVEPRLPPVDKACGEGLMPCGVRALGRLDVEVGGVPLRGIRYLSQRHQAAAYFRTGPGAGIRRVTLHAALYQRAIDVGVSFRRGRVDSLLQRPHLVEAAATRARWLVGADGLHSQVRRLAGLEAERHRIRRYGLRAHFLAEPWTDLVEVHWARDAEAYVTPVSERVVGVAVLGASRQAGFAERLSRFPLLARRLLGQQVSSVRGAGPLWSRVRRRVEGRVLLAGDAAGYIDALTGEGLALAMESAEILVSCLLAGEPERYEDRWRTLSRRHRLLTGALVRARTVPGAAGLIVPASAALPAAFAAAVHCLELATANEPASQRASERLAESRTLVMLVRPILVLPT